MEMNATVGTRGKAVHSATGSFNKGTRCGAEHGGGKASSILHPVNQEVTCRKCLKLMKHKSVSVPSIPGPNARVNYTAMIKAAVSPASVAFWTRKLNALPA